MKAAKVKIVKGVNVEGQCYMKASPAALRYSCLSAARNHFKNRHFRNFNEWQDVAFRRSLPVFERILGVTKNKKNPRAEHLIDTRILFPNS